MNNRLTNQKLNGLLAALGFESNPSAAANYRVWRHPISQCAILLPANKTLEPSRPADVVGLKAQLSLQGHLEEAAFDVYATEGRLPAELSKRS